MRTCLVSLLLLVAAPAMAEEPATWPEPLIPPPGGDAEAQVIAAFRCTCEGLGERRLAAPECNCTDAFEDRSLIREQVRAYPADAQSSGAASLVAMFNALDEPRLLMAVDYDHATYDQLWATTRSVCPGEYLQRFETGPVSCRIRAMWSQRFKGMLALGYTADQAFRFYVAESNATMGRSEPWTEEELRYSERSSITWLIPVGLVLVILCFIAISIVRRNRREAAAEARAPKLTRDDRARLEDELDL